MPDLKRAALQYARMGYAVLACVPREKRPLTACCPHGLKDATTDVETVERWWTEHPLANIGIRLGSASVGNPMVIDVDDPSLANQLLAPELVVTEETWVATTGRGCHIWVSTEKPTNTRIITRKSGRAKVGELRGNNSYVIVPPSIHATGRPYRWVGLAKRELE